MSSSSQRCGEKPSAWLVCAAMFLVNFLGLGFSYSLGVYFVVFLEVYGESRSKTALLSSLNYGFLCISGPLVSLVIHRFGFRVAMFLGGILSSLGMLITAFSATFWQMLLGIGVFSGIGFGFTYTGSVVAVGLHFHHLRSLALGIAISGAGLGTMLQPMLNDALVNHYGWRSALLLVSGMTLNILVSAMLLKPRISIPHYHDNLKKEEIHGTTETQSFMKEHGLDLFKNPGFLLVFLSTVLFVIGMLGMVTHLSGFGVWIGHTETASASFISMTGIGGFVGRLLTSMMSQYLFHPVIVITLAYILSGVSVIVLTWWTSYTGMAVLSFLYGVGMSGCGPVLADIVMHVTGRRNFNMGYGWNGISQGFSLAGGPLAGLMYDLTGYYPASFYFSGSFIILGGLAALPILLTDKVSYDKRHPDQAIAIPDATINKSEEEKLSKTMENTYI